MNLDVSSIEDYIIAAALTGPGIVELNALKVFITGEIRRACGIPKTSGPSVRDEPTDIEVLRRCVYWLRNETPEYRYLRQTTAHWLSHAHRALFQLGCEYDHWLYRFVHLLAEVIYNPHYPAALDKLNQHLDEFTEENSRIGDKK